VAYQLAGPSPPVINIRTPINTSTFELRVTNRIERWPKYRILRGALGPIGNSLSAGCFAMLEGLSSYAFRLAADLGNADSPSWCIGISVLATKCVGGTSKGHILSTISERDAFIYSF